MTREQLERELASLTSALVDTANSDNVPAETTRQARLHLRDLCARYVDLHDLCGRETLPAIRVPGLEDASQPEKGGR